MRKSTKAYLFENIEPDCDALRNATINQIIQLHAQTEMLIEKAFSEASYFQNDFHEISAMQQKRINE